MRLIAIYEFANADTSRKQNIAQRQKNLSPTHACNYDKTNSESP